MDVKTDRSPSYPAIDLRDAIERAKLLYTKIQRNPAPTTIIPTYWGYSDKSSGGRMALAALKKYGLVDYVRSGDVLRAKLSDLGLAIVQDERQESPNRDRLIRQAALNPTIYGELWTRFGGQDLPDEEVLKFEVRQLGFTEAAVKDVVSQFLETVSFAKLADEPAEQEQDEMQPPAPASIFDGGPTPPSPKTAPPADGLRELALPLSPTETAYLRLPKSIDERKWRQMLAILDVMKGGIIVEDHPPIPKTTSLLR